MRPESRPAAIACSRERRFAHAEVRRRVCARIGQTELRRLRPAAQATPRPSVAGLQPVVVEADAWVTTARLMHDTARLCSCLPGDIDAVVGIARSGLLPAAHVAVMLHRPLYSVKTFESDPAGILDCGGGWRLQGVPPRAATADPKTVLIVDDTTWHGIAMRHVKRLATRRWPAARILTAVVYAHPQTLHLLDFAACAYAGPHYLEWNLFNAGHADPAVGGGLVSDLDGILCHDIAPGDDDDGPRYLAAIRDALPIQRPNRRPLSLIVTARLEKYRAQTEAWLRRCGIAWHRLAMGPWSTLRQRNAGWPENVVRLKSDAYRASTCRLMIESDPLLARRICQSAGKPVLCPQLGRVLEPETTRPAKTSEVGNRRQGPAAR